MADPSILAVLGAGAMGHGIAQVAASAGLVVRIYDLSAEAAAAGQQRIVAALDRLVGKGKLSAETAEQTTRRLSATGDLAQATADADIIIEAAPENLDLKVDLLLRAKVAAKPNALLGSNTSSLSITELARRLQETHRCVGLHFFNPVPVMELLEIVRGLDTPDETVQHAEALARTLGKTPIVIRDFPGFATSRLGVCIGAEAMRMLEQGVGSVADIDRAMELGYRHPMGPLKLTDLVGLDVRLAILEHLHRELGEVFRPPPLLRQMVRAGRLGKKSGAGFYRWTDAGPLPF